MGDPSAAPPGSASRLRRPQRVLLLLLGVWVLSAFDLGFTLHQARKHHFVEMNPLAARLLHGSPLTLVAYKFALLGAGTLILFCVRRHAVAELACWFLLAACFYVGVRWYVYYEGALALDPSWLLDAPP